MSDEKRREQDIRERDELDKKIKENDKNKSRVVIDPQKTQLALTKEERAQILPELKETARYKYLDDRTKK